VRSKYESKLEDLYGDKESLAYMGLTKSKLTATIDQYEPCLNCANGVIRLHIGTIGNMNSQFYPGFFLRTSE
jgi:hypothetical protein